MNGGRAPATAWPVLGGAGPESGVLVPVPVSPRRVRIAKRTVDVLLATVGLLVCLPLMVLAGLLIKLHDRGPVFFRQERVGKAGARFVMFKFRTMVLGAERLLPEVQGRNRRDGPLFKVSDDPRVTRVGRVLRATSIDELPQLVNVLRGDMSLVGPRPALPQEVAQFDHVLLRRLHVPPGLTGLWQVKARDDPSFQSYREHDLFYIENWSLMLDLLILLATVGVVLRRSLLVGRLRHTDRRPVLLD